jgi:hypothetical protein
LITPLPHRLPTKVPLRATPPRQSKVPVKLSLARVATPENTSGEHALTDPVASKAPVIVSIVPLALIGP